MLQGQPAAAKPGQGDHGGGPEHRSDAVAEQEAAVGHRHRAGHGSGQDAQHGNKAAQQHGLIGLAAELLSPALQALGRQPQQFAQTLQQRPAGQSAHQITDIVAGDGPGSSGPHHPQEVELSTAGGIAASQGDRFTW